MRHWHDTWQKGRREEAGQGGVQAKARRHAPGEHAVGNTHQALRTRTKGRERANTLNLSQQS